MTDSPARAGLLGSGPCRRHFSRSASCWRSPASQGLCTIFNGFRLFAFVARVPFLARYDLYVSAALLVLGVALLIAGDRTKSQ